MPSNNSLNGFGPFPIPAVKSSKGFLPAPRPNMSRGFFGGSFEGSLGASLGLSPPGGLPRLASGAMKLFISAPPVSANALNEFAPCDIRFDMVDVPAVMGIVKSSDNPGT